MKKSPLIFAAGTLTGALLMAGIGWMIMPDMMIHDTATTLNLDETVNRITENARARGWVVSGVIPIDESIVKHGGDKIVPVRLINMCQAEYASRILNDPESRPVSVMMPCTIAVYSDEDGATHVSSMNTGLMGKMFGGVIAEVMGGSVAADEAAMLEFIKEK